MNLGCVVEGHGDEAALPHVIRRLDSTLVVPRPVRVPRGKLVQEAEVIRAVRLAAAKAGDDARILIVFDADDDCPVELASSVTRWAEQCVPVGHVSVVVAEREFEGWFLAAASSLRGVRGLADDLDPPSSPEAMRNAKRWLSDNMVGSRSYRETVDQPAMAALMDLELARTARSFDKLCREVERLART